jgi:hypothetical protein
MDILLSFKREDSEEEYKASSQPYILGGSVGVGSGVINRYKNSFITKVMISASAVIVYIGLHCVNSRV